MNSHEFSILRSGGIYFFYRLKVKNPDETQRFFLALSSKTRKYDLLIVGKKQLPTEKDKYFLLVDSVNKSKSELLESLKERHHRVGKGETTDPTAHCLAEGKYLLVKHDNHTHFIYQLTRPSQIKKIQQEFNLKKEDDYLIAVKNPQRSSEKPKVSYPHNLQEKLGNYSFIPLDPAKFLDYQGTELLMISKKTADLSQREELLQKCLTEIKVPDLAKEFAKITSPESIAPLKED